MHLRPLGPREVQSCAAALFADEFDGPAGSVPDYAKWTVARGVSGDGRRNVFLDGNSNLVVRATREGDRYVGESRQLGGPQITLCAGR